MCMYVCIYVCVYVCMYLCVYVWMCIFFMYGLLLAPLRLYNGNTTSIVLNGYSCYS
jgi:hypothetical protein